MLKTQLAAPVCLVAKSDDEALLWHGRYGHLNFRALLDFGVKKMVEGMPLLDRVEQFCDGWALGNQRRYSFPQVAGCSSSHNLDLVHVDLCGQIKLKTLGVRAISCS
jgi:hypothetical protein